MILNRLKADTAHFHKLAEEYNYTNQLQNGSITNEEYIILLKRLYAFFSQTVILSRNFPGNDVADTYFFCSKVNLLRSDLFNSQVMMHVSDSVFEQVDYYEYLGFCYVSMGSLLGGQYIYRNLLKMQREKEMQLSLLFYGSCKNSVYTDWKKFTNDLQLVNEVHHMSILNGAKICYLYFLYLCKTIDK